MILTSRILSVRLMREARDAGAKKMPGCSGVCLKNNSNIAPNLDGIFPAQANVALTPRYAGAKKRVDIAQPARGIAKIKDTTALTRCCGEDSCGCFIAA